MNDKLTISVDKAMAKIIEEQDQKIKDIIGRIETIISGANAEYYAYDKNFIVKCLEEIVEKNKDER